MKTKPCGNPDCSVSTGICDSSEGPWIGGGSLTFGHGELDDLGFWEYPCPICARAWEKANPEDGRCWPFEKKNKT
jgi:hypothetical protein